MMRKVIGVTLLALLAGLTDGRGVLLRRDDHLQMEIEVDTRSGQRRELGWGSGGFSWGFFVSGRDLSLCSGH
jgi:hypothetical protein